MTVEPLRKAGRPFVYWLEELSVSPLTGCGGPNNRIQTTEQPESTRPPRDMFFLVPQSITCHVVYVLHSLQINNYNKVQKILQKQNCERREGNYTMKEENKGFLDSSLGADPCCLATCIPSLRNTQWEELTESPKLYLYCSPWPARYFLSGASCSPSDSLITKMSWDEQHQCYFHSQA